MEESLKLLNLNRMLKTKTSSKKSKIPHNEQDDKEIDCMVFSDGSDDEQIIK